MSEEKEKLKKLINELFTKEEKEQIRKHMLANKERIINDTCNAMQDFTDGLKEGLKNYENKGE